MQSAGGVLVANAGNVSFRRVLHVRNLCYCHSNRFDFGMDHTKVQHQNPQRRTYCNSEEKIQLGLCYWRPAVWHWLGFFRRMPRPYAGINWRGKIYFYPCVFKFAGGHMGV